MKHAERALELGRGDAAVVLRHLAAALAKLGEKDKAISVLQAYVRDNHDDTAARKQLERLPLAEARNARGVAETANQEMVEPWTLDRITALLPTNWMPPDTDKKVPPVDPGASCALDEVVKKAGHRIEELVYTASQRRNPCNMKRSTNGVWKRPRKSASLTTWFPSRKRRRGCSMFKNSGKRQALLAILRTACSRSGYPPWCSFFILTM